MSCLLAGGGRPLCLTFGNAYLLTPRSTVLPEKLPVSQLVKKFLAFYGTQTSLTYSQVLDPVHTPIS